MITNPFEKSSHKIKRRENPKGKYSQLNTQELLHAVKLSANSTHRGDLDILLELFLDRYNSRQEELDNLNQDLAERIEIEVNLSKANQKKYEQQAKMAAMGEMMDAVAHQWKQPLNALSMLSDLLIDDFNDANVDVDKDYIKDFTDTSQSQIEHMVTTLSEFRNFFRTKTTNESFGIKRCIQSVMLLVKDEFLKNNIKINIINNKEILINANENEFKHLVLNIINNSKDAFNERDIKLRNIEINCYHKNNYLHIDMADNAGGIPLHIIDHIFKPEVTTKEDSKGTGIGLYMSMQIAQKLGGSLSVKNLNNGALFKLKIPL